jgi:hypothetical protein
MLACPVEARQKERTTVPKSEVLEIVGHRGARGLRLDARQDYRRRGERIVRASWRTKISTRPLR